VKTTSLWLALLAVTGFLFASAAFRTPGEPERGQGAAREGEFTLAVADPDRWLPGCYVDVEEEGLWVAFLLVS
jgi:hypothetical protein